MEGYFNILRETSITLLKNGIGQRQIFDIIRKALKDEVNNLPKQKILYCATYGGFGLTNDFAEFIYKDYDQNVDTEISYYPERVYTVKFLEPYGKSLAEKYPIIMILVNNYLHYDLDDKFRYLHRLRYKKQDLDNIKINKEKIINNTVFGDKELINETYYLQYPLNVEEYTKESLEIALTKLPNILELCESNINEIMSVLRETFIDEHIDQILEIISKTKYDNSLIFHNAVKKYGELNPIIWNYTHDKFYNSAMIFLLSQLKDTNQNQDLIKNNNIPIHDNLYLELGLTFAAEGCKLGIAEVPANLDWKITEYDGLETVILI